MHLVNRITLAASLALAAALSAAPAQAALMGVVSGCAVIPASAIGVGGSCVTDPDGPGDVFGAVTANVGAGVEFGVLSETFLRIEADLNPLDDTITIRFTELAGLPLIPGVTGGPLVFGFGFSGLQLQDAASNPLDITSINFVAGRALFPGSTSVTANGVLFEIEIDALGANETDFGTYQLVGTTQQTVPAPGTLVLAALGLLAAARRHRRR